MTRAYLITGLVLAAIVIPAAAATDYYVIKDMTSKKCSVSNKKPDGTKTMMIGMAYKTKAEADKGLKASAECK